MALFNFKDLSSLSNVDMTIYRYIAQNSNQVIYMRVRDIAQNAHVSNSSVMRFVHKVGFNSFPELKSFLKNSLHGQMPETEFKFITSDTFPKDINNKIQLVANKIYQSDNVICLGMGSSAFIAEYAARQLASIGYNTNVVKDPFYPLYPQLRNTTNNVMICYSVSGKTTELVELLNDFVNDEDITIIAITANETSLIGRMSRYCLTYKEHEYRLDGSFDLSSQIPAMYISEAITTSLLKIS